MKPKPGCPLSFQAEIRERFDRPAARRWHAQFAFYPLGYFRGEGPCPGLALAAAWERFRREVDSGERWWTIVQGPVPPIRY